MSEELKPCPFCGGPAEHDHDDDGYCWVQCRNCGVSTDTATHGNTDARVKLADMWNTRATLSPAHIEDEREAAIAQFAQTFPMTSESAAGGNPYDIELRRYYLLGWDDRAALSAPPGAVPAELTNVRCMCGDEYPHDSYGAGFIAGSGMCENCDAAQRAVRDADRKAMDELKAMSFDELLRLSEGKAPPAAGVLDAAAWETRCTTERRFSINQCSAEERASHWREQGRAGVEVRALVYAAPTPPAAGVPIGMACKINGYWEAQLFAGHGCIDRQSLYAHPLPPADVPPGLAHRLLKAYDHGDTGAIEAAIEDIRTMLAAAPTPPASEQQRAVVMPERKRAVYGEGDEGRRKEGWNDCLDELLRLNPHLAKGEGV